jgi:uroporphyrinogen-III synthase
MADNDAHGDTDGPGGTVLLTRPRAQSAGFADQIRARLPGLRVVIAPLMEIVSTGGVPDLAAGDAVIFTSANGASRAGQGNGRRAWCVGERTAAAAREAGYDACVAGRTADELVARLRAVRPAGRLVHLHGAHTRGDVVARLAADGLQVDGVAIYDQVAVPPDAAFHAALAAAPVIAPLFSPRSAMLFAEAAGQATDARPPSGLRPVALSTAVRDSLPAAWHGATTVCDRPDATAMLDGIVRQVYP